MKTTSPSGAMSTCSTSAIVSHVPDDVERKQGADEVEVLVDGKVGLNV